ncbi:MAG: Rieske 2Fe-2S domain-containing protein [Planctomycetia bacterium]|nr:Rieske 2Fe-2S domain-containing protein [Planctomycetia bacterium]
MKNGNNCDGKDTACGGTSEDRRSFCKSTLALGVGAAALAVPVYGGARMSLYPLQQTGMSGKEYQLTTLDNLDETPRLYAVVDTIRDAWVSAPDQTIGNIFIRKVKQADGKFGVEALQSVCPHAGCRIKVDTQKNPKTGKEETLFFCPCHGDIFTLDGKRTSPEKQMSARDMDSLEARVDDKGNVFVKFQNFRLGDSQKHPV